MSRKDLLPITLGAQRETWRMGDGEHERDEEFRLIRPKILERDNFSCRFCGFYSRSYQEVHHLDDDHQNNRQENLVTACPFCHSCFHIGYAGLMREGFLIWVSPTENISQAAVNNLARAVYVVSRVPGHDWTDPVKRLMDAVSFRKDSAERYFGTSNPLVLGDALLSLTAREYANRNETLMHIRYFPEPRRYNLSADIWPAISDFYISKHGPFGALPPKNWPQIVSGITL